MRAFIKITRWYNEKLWSDDHNPMMHHRNMMVFICRRYCHCISALVEETKWISHHFNPCFALLDHRQLHCCGHACRPSEWILTWCHGESSSIYTREHEFRCFLLWLGKEWLSEQRFQIQFCGSLRVNVPYF